MLEKTEGATKMANPEKPLLYTQTGTNNVNKTWDFLQTTGGKNEPNIVYMREPQRTSQHGTQNAKIGQNVGHHYTQTYTKTQ
jgi:poly-D-alanine transfer protein DltD